MNPVEVTAWQCACGQLFPATTSGQKACAEHCLCTVCKVSYCGSVRPICGTCYLDQRIAQAVKDRVP